MAEEKTLLQQIRDKEQEFSRKIEVVKQENDAQVAAAREEREAVLREAEQAGKRSAEEWYQKDRELASLDIDAMKRDADRRVEEARGKGEKNLGPVVERILSDITSQ